MTPAVGHQKLALHLGSRQAQQGLRRQLKGDKLVSHVYRRRRRQGIIHAFSIWRAYTSTNSHRHTVAGAAGNGRPPLPRNAGRARDHLLFPRTRRGINSGVLQMKKPTEEQRPSFPAHRKAKEDEQRTYQEQKRPRRRNTADDMRR